MKANLKEKLQSVMKLAWQFRKKNGYSASEALKCAWANINLKAKLVGGIVKFYFQKTDSTIREAFGTLKAELMPELSGNDNRKKNDTVQVYFDTEKEAFRCFKKANLIRIA